MLEGLAGSIEVTQRIEAPPEIVFAYLTDSARFIQWMGVGAQLDPRPGGRYRIDIDGDHIVIGQYQEVEPPHRLVMSWGWQGHPTVPPGSTTVEITLTPEKGATLLRLRHLGLPSDGERRLHTQGWNQYTGKLKEVATRPPP